MSSEKPTDFDHEILLFLSWIRTNYRLENDNKGFNRWLYLANGVPYSEDSEELVLATYQASKNSKKC